MITQSSNQNEITEKIDIYQVNTSTLICYNCSSINLKGDLENGIINVTCDRINNNAGQDWTLIIGGQQVVLNKSVTITLSLLNLSPSTNVVVQMNVRLNPEYLIFRCNTSDQSKKILSKNCTYTFSNLEPGSIVNVSFIRLTITIPDEISKTFPEETFQRIYLTGLYQSKVFHIENSP